LTTASKRSRASKCRRSAETCCCASRLNAINAERRSRDWTCRFAWLPCERCSRVARPLRFHPARYGPPRYPHRRDRDPHQPRSASVSPPKHGLKDAARRYAVSLRSVLDPASGRRSWASKGLSRALASEGVARPSPKPMEDRRDPPAVGWGKP
jgi:hypothetical protein